MKLDTSKTTSTWSTGGFGGKTTGAVGGGADGTGKLPVQPGCNSSTAPSTSTDTFTSSTSTGTTVNLTGT